MQAITPARCSKKYAAGWMLEHWIEVDLMKIEPTGSADSKRIVSDNGEVVALCERYTGGLWAVHDVDSNKKLCAAVHKTPRAALIWFQDSQ